MLFRSDGVPWQLVERLRPTVNVTLSRRVVLSGTGELSLVQGRDLGRELRRTVLESEVGPLVEALCEWPEDDTMALSDVFRLDRLHLDVYLPQVDLRVGRQAVQWGSAMMINPSDPFPEVLFTEPWRPRRGVNAARATVPIPGGHQIQAVVGLDDRFRHVRAAARGTVQAANVDVSVVGAFRSDDTSGRVGVDVRGTWAVGLWLEGVVHLDQGAYGEGVWEELAVGLDWNGTMLQGVGVAAQYYRSGRKAAGGGLSSALASVELPECDGVDVGERLGFGGEVDPFAPVFSGSDYLLLMGRVGIVRELSVSAVLLQNLGDGTGVAVPTLSLRPNGWLELGVAGQVPYRMWGDGGEFSPNEEDLVQRLEVVPGVEGPTLDLRGLVPKATVTGWLRYNF